MRETSSTGSTAAPTRGRRTGMQSTMLSSDSTLRTPVACSGRRRSADSMALAVTQINGRGALVAIAEVSMISNYATRAQYLLCHRVRKILGRRDEAIHLFDGIPDASV